MVKMDSPTVWASRAMLTAGKSNHSDVGTQFFVYLEMSPYLEKNHGWSKQSTVNSTVNCSKMAEWMSLGCWLE